MPASARARAILALLIAAFMYGATFVVVKSAVEDTNPIAFVAWRFLLGAVLLGALALPRGARIWRHGSIAGIALFAGYALQTAGLTETTASNSALITGLYVVITPFLASFLAKRAPGWWSVLGAALSFAGLFLLTGTNDLSFERGDVLTLGCAFAFAAYIVIVSRFARLHPVIQFTAVQLVVTAVLAFGVSWAIDGVSLPPRSVWVALLITGIGVSALAFLLQIWAQTVVEPAIAAIVTAAESVFGVATAWLALGERLDLPGIAGACIIVLAIIVVVGKQRDPILLETESVTPTH